MKKAIIIISFTGLVLVTGACNDPSKKEIKSTEKTKPKGKYYCTMHPEVTSDKPGTCPKCGMDLVERDTVGK